MFPYLNTGNSRKGSSNIIRRVKVVKVNGAILSIATTGNLKQLAVGSDQGYVSLSPACFSNILLLKQNAEQSILNSEVYVLYLVHTGVFDRSRGSRCVV